MRFKFLMIVFIGMRCTVWPVALDITPHKNPISKKTVAADKVTQAIAQKLLIEQNLHLIGTGSGMMYEIEMLGMSFDYYKEVDIGAARKLLVKTVQKYLQEINNSDEIRKYLTNYPFTANNIEIRIWVRKPEEISIAESKLNYFSAIGGKLYYKYDDTKPFSNGMLYPSSSIRLLHEETFDEALKVLSESEQKAQTVESDK